MAPNTIHNRRGRRNIALCTASRGIVIVNGAFAGKSGTLLFYGSAFAGGGRRCGVVADMLPAGACTLVQPLRA